ncbi:MAG: anaerobic ribonucleoside-triphosphate reductase activating protein [Lachnospiraceae bacterium]|nr:anaerobic ribonucleoside-triphosphate reductase activating protein [Lachnospiraceae bacterium]
MNIHGIETDSMTNGDGLRVVLWVSGCSHHCKGCHNPQTHDPESGFKFELEHLRMLYEELEKDYVAGITFSGGDPLYIENRMQIQGLAMDIKRRFPDKTIWLYTGYKWEDISHFISHLEILKYIDVLVDGRFVEELASINYPWAGSTNQRVIDVQRSLKEGQVILWESDKGERWNNERN